MGQERFGANPSPDAGLVRTFRLAPGAAALAAGARDPSGVPCALIEAEQADPSRELARSRSTDTALVPVAGVGLVVRKRWRWTRLRERLKGVGRTTALAASPAEREFAALARTYATGAFHPEPLAFVVARRRGLVASCTLFLTPVPDAIDLATWLRDTHDAALRRRVLADLARRTRAMHDAHVLDGEHHLRNVLVDGARTWKVDCPKARELVRLAPPRAAHDLGCADVGLARFASRAERLRALRAYVGETAPRSTLRAWVERVRRARARVDARESRRLPATT